MSFKLRLFLPVFVVFVAACGGGGSGGTQSDPDPEPEPEPETTPSIDDLGGSPLEYNGMTQWASVTPQNAFEFLGVAFMLGGGINGEDSCEAGSIHILSRELDESDNGSLLLEYDNCQVGGVTANGRASSTVKEGGTDITLNFNALTLTGTAVETTILSGRVHNQFDESPNSCSGVREIYNIVAHEIEADIYYQAEDLLAIRANRCDIGSPSTLRGRVYHSDYGYVEISTISPYTYSNRMPNSEFHLFPNHSGHIRLEGANDTKGNFEVNIDYVYRQNTINHKIAWVQFSVDTNGDGLPDNISKLTVSQFNQGASADLGDNDGDGIINSWEVAYGLDPVDPNDAELDNDFDGYSNLEEYLFFGNPNNSDEIPRVTDLSLTFSEASGATRAGQLFDVSVGVSNPNLLYGAEGVTVTLVKPPTVSWVNLPTNCISLGQNEIQCDKDTIGQKIFIRYSVQAISDEPGEILFSATVDSATHDSNLANNYAEMVKTIDQRNIDLGVELSAFEYRSEKNVIINESTSYKIDVTQWGDEARNTVLSMNIPPNIEIESADFTIPYTVEGPPRTGSCDISVRLVCALGTIPANGASYKGSIDIAVTGISQGIISQTIEITGEGEEKDLSDNAVTFTTFVGQSLAPIQTAIDSASPGETVVIPDGLYVGAISLVAGDVSITSASGPQSTTIWLANPLELGQSTTVSNLTFTGRSRLFANEVTDLVITGNHFRNMSNAIYFSPASGEIYNNRFTGGESGGVTGCKQIQVASYTLGVAYQSAVFNNIFYNNTSQYSGCIGVAITGYLQDGHNIEIINNTFVDNQTAISAVKHNDSLSRINIINNILQNNTHAIHVREQAGVGGSFEPKVSNNLFYQNETDTYGVSTDQLTENISGNPALMDVADGDFRPSASSVAIDTGTDVSAPLFDFDNSPRPIDGDSNGISTTDIGALEFIP